MQQRRFLGYLALLVAGALLSGCHKSGNGTGGEANKSANSSAPLVFRFGHQHEGDIYLLRPVEAGALRQKSTGIDSALWQLIQSHAERTGIVPITESVIQAQQLTADNYYKIGLLPRKLNIRDCVLTPAQYAQFVPANAPPTQSVDVALILEEVRIRARNTQFCPIHSSSAGFSVI